MTISTAKMTKMTDKTRVNFNKVLSTPRRVRYTESDCPKIPPKPPPCN